MAVGRGARHQLGRDYAARAGNVLDHERPAEGIGSLAASRRARTSGLPPGAAAAISRTLFGRIVLRLRTERDGRPIARR